VWEIWKERTATSPAETDKGCQTTDRSVTASSWLRDLRRSLQSSWTQLITPSRNSVDVQWRSLFRSTFLGKWCTSYNAPPTYRKRATDRWSPRNFLPRCSLFMVGKAQKSHRARSGLYDGCSNGVPPIHFFQFENIIQFRSRSMRFLGFFNHV
jgi:hypothetical protein